MRRSIALVTAAFLSGAFTSVAVRADPPAGFELEGDAWTLKEADWSVSGILIKPEGNGPFPAVVISHGLGGSARGFSLPKARELARRGFICIAPDYTHAGRGGDRATFGASAENIRRGAACVRILRGMEDVNSKRIYLYGNSMGAFLTVALAAELPDQIAAAAITAGGAVEQDGFPAPSTKTAAKMRSPLLILHGTADTTVPPQRSELLKRVLEENKITVQRQLFEGIGHDLHQKKSAEVLTASIKWFEDHPPK